MRKSKIITGLGLVVVLAFISACTSDEVEQVKGILQNVDAVKGEITIVTEDGQTITLEIDTETLVEVEGESSTFGTLEVGASVQVEVNEDNQVVELIEVQQTEIEIEEEAEADKMGEVGGEVDVEVGVDVAPEVDVEPDEEDKPSVEPGMDQEGNATPDGDVDIDGDGMITIVDVVGGMEAERERLAEEIRKRQADGEVDADWVREVEAERERLAEEIRRALSDDTYIVVIDGRWLIMDIDPIEVVIDPVIDPPDDDNILTITNGTVQKIEGNFWTIIDQDGVIWVINVSDLNLDVDTVVGSKVTLSAIIYDEGIVAHEAEVYPAEEDDPLVDDHADDGGDHADDGDDHADDGDDHADDGDDHADDGGGDVEDHGDDH